MIERIAWLLARPFAAPDPLGPVGQAPDTARDLACDLTASGRICSPPPPDSIPPPDADRPPLPPAAAVGFGGLGTLLVIILVLALAAILLWIAMKYFRMRNAETDEVADGADELDEEVDGELAERVIDTERPPDRWRRVAAEHRAAGRLRDAIRCEYRALVGDLARAGVVDEIPGRTSGEERRQLRRLAPTVSGDFDRAADLFDAAWFDDSDVTVAHDDEFRVASQTVLDTVLSGARRVRR